ncbi:MAG TPA: type II toxin-antitoxin system RelE/ParE family toxin [Patescibacteria group bacterium]|nr:type II toxin-antitoxin system RelE/ParE family toxin [Patescibacteria group bacterium]
MAWIIEFDPSAEKELDKLDSQQAKRILKFLFDRVSHLDDPRSIGEALKGSKFNTLWKYRVGDYRIITSIEDNIARILVVRIGDRKEVYR